MIDKRKFYINGTWVNPIIKNDFDVINPSNEQSYAVISLGSINDVNLAVEAAKNAFFASFTARSTSFLDPKEI